MASQMERDERQLADLQRQVADGNGSLLRHTATVSTPSR